MAKKKKSGILGNRILSDVQHGRTKPAKGGATSSKAKTDVGQATRLQLHSPLHRQCSTIVGKLLRASATGKSGATLKGLCLAPHVQNKAAVYAVVCETLRYEPILNQILEETDVEKDHPEVRSRVCYCDGR
jgi:hypothetical protein